MFSKNLKIPLLIFVFILFTSSGFSLAKLHGVYDAEGDFPPEGDLPESKKEVSGNMTVIIEATSESLAAPVDEVQAQFTPRDGGETIDVTAKKVGDKCPWYEDNGDLGTGCRYAANFNVNEHGSGNYTVGGRINYRALDGWSYTSNLTTLSDNKAPIVSGKEPQGGVNPENPVSISVESFDEHSSVKNIQIDILESGEVIKEWSTDKETLDLSVTNLIEERKKYVVRYEVLDQLGNEKSGNWEFFTDNQYTGDENPEYPKEGTLKWPKKDNKTGRVETMDLKVEYKETEDSYENFGIKQTCLHKGEEIDKEVQNSSEKVKKETFNLTCQLPKKRFMNEKANITFKTCDKVGNCMEETTKTYKFDGNKPVIHEANLPAEKFVGEFLLDVNATDDTSEVEKIRYRYEDHSPVKVDYRGQETVIQPPGNYPAIARMYPLTVQAIDSSGQLSKKANLTAEYVEEGGVGVQMSSRALEHNISIITPQKGYSIESKQPEEIQIGIKNNESVYLSKAEIEVDSPLIEDSKTVKHVPPGEEEFLKFGIETEKYGEKSLRIEVKGNLKETSIVVEPTAEQVKDIVDRHEDTAEKYQEMEDKINEMKQKPVEESKKERLQENLTKLENLRSNTSKALDEGNYDRAMKNFEEFEKISKETENSYNQYMDSYKHSRWIGGILITFGGILGLIILLEAFFQTSDEYDISFTDIEYIRIAERTTKRLMKGVMSSVESLTGKVSQYGFIPSAEKIMALMTSTKAKSKGLFYDKEFEEYEN